MPTTPSISKAVRRVLRREFTIFFTKMLAEEPGWPKIPEAEFIDALADSLMDSSKAAGKHPVAYVQSLVHELQDRINHNLKG